MTDLEISHLLEEKFADCNSAIAIAELKTQKQPVHRRNDTLRLYALEAHCRGSFLQEIILSRSFLMCFTTVSPLGISVLPRKLTHLMKFR